MTAARRETPQRCEGRYPVPQARDEPFEVTYRCALSVGHLGPHRSEPITDGADDRLGPIGIYERALRSIAANSCCTSCRETALVAEAALREAEPPQDESLAVAHARKQGAADGFQDGWHAALQRMREGDKLHDLGELVPCPSSLSASVIAGTGLEGQAGKPSAAKPSGPLPATSEHIDADNSLGESRPPAATPPPQLSIEVTEDEIRGLIGYVTWHGGAHVEGCPADDTCDCSGKLLNDAVNSVCRKAFDAQVQQAAAPRVSAVPLPHDQEKP
jgi:hypothetical protein